MHTVAPSKKEGPRQKEGKHQGNFKIPYFRVYENENVHSMDCTNRAPNAAKQLHSTDPVSAVKQKSKTLLGVKHGIEIVHHRTYIQ